MATSLTRDQLKSKLTELDIPHRSNDSKLVLLHLLNGEIQPTPLRSPRKKISPSTKPLTPSPKPLSKTLVLNNFGNLLSLPEDVLIETALNLDNESLMNLCLTNKKTYDKICANDVFWKRKFVKDERVAPSDYQGTWKNLYENYRNIYFMDPGTIDAEIGFFKHPLVEYSSKKIFVKPQTLYEKFNLLPIYVAKRSCQRLITLVLLTQQIK